MTTPLPVGLDAPETPTLEQRVAALESLVAKLMEQTYDPL